MTLPRATKQVKVAHIQPAREVSHKPGSRLPLLSARPAITLATLKTAATNSLLGERGTMGVNSLPKTVTWQRRGCDLNPGAAPESSTLTTRLPTWEAVQIGSNFIKQHPETVIYVLKLPKC